MHDKHILEENHDERKEKRRRRGRAGMVDELPIRVASPLSDKKP